MALLQTDYPAGTRFQLSVNNADPVDLLAVDPNVLPAGPTTAFKGTFYVNSAFGGVQTGSESNPFTTIAAAFAAAAALALGGATVRLPPAVVHTENVTFPTSGDWLIEAAPPYATSTFGTQLVGNVTCNTTALARIAFSGVIISGNVAGNSLATSVFALWNVRVTGTINLTTTGSTWVALFGGGPGVADPNRLTGNVIGACSIAGRILASDYSFEGPLSDAPSVQWSQFRNCRIVGGSYTMGGVAATSLRLFDCTFEVAMTFSAANNVQLGLSPESMTQLLNVGYTAAGAGTITTFTLSSQVSAFSQVNGNIGATGFSAGTVPPGLYEASGTLSVTTAGTAGTAALNIQYTDLFGVLQTKQVAGQLITAAAGTESGGVLQFRTNGTTGFRWSVSGVVTPGALVLQTAMACRRLD